MAASDPTDRPSCRATQTSSRRLRLGIPGQVRFINASHGDDDSGIDRRRPTSSTTATGSHGGTGSGTTMLGRHWLPTRTRGPLGHGALGSGGVRLGVRVAAGDTGIITQGLRVRLSESLSYHTATSLQLEVLPV